MTRAQRVLSAVALAIVAASADGCKAKVPHAKVAANGPPPTSFRVVPFGYNPAVSGISGAGGEIVYENGGAHAWVYTGPLSTDWSVFPQAGGGGGIAADGGVTAPLSGLGTVLSPLAIAAATSGVAGSMSAADKAKLDSIGPTWVANELKAAQALLGSTVTSYLALYGNDFVASSANTGTIAYSKAGVQVQTGTSTTRVGLATYKSATFIPLIPGPATGVKFYASYGAKLVGSADANSIHIMGLTDFVADNLEFELLGSASTTIWRVTGTRGGSAFTIAGTGAGATADFSAYHRYAIASTGLAYTFYVDAVAIATTAAISAGPIGDSAWFVQVQNAATATNREIDVEQIFMAWAGDI